MAKSSVYVFFLNCVLRQKKQTLIKLSWYFFLYFFQTSDTNKRTWPFIWCSFLPLNEDNSSFQYLILAFDLKKLKLHCLPSVWQHLVLCRQWNVHFTQLFDKPETDWCFKYVFSMLALSTNPHKQTKQTNKNEL